MTTKLFFRHQKQIEALARKNAIAYLALFGSYARGEQKPTSDIDFLVEFNKPVGLLHLIRTEHELEDVLNKKVDLVTRKGLSKYLKPYIDQDLKVIYEAN